MSKESFGLIEFSSKYNARLDLFENVINDYTSRPEVSVICITEMTDNARVDYVRSLDGWGSVAYDSNVKGESAILWRESDFDEIEHGSQIMSHTPFFMRSGHKRKPINFPHVVLYSHEYKRFFVIYTGHLPAGVGDQRHGWASKRHGKVYREVCSSFRRHYQEMQRKYPNAKIVLGTDTNRDMRKPWVRAWAKANIGLKSSWTAKTVRGKTGTHGKRKIDDVRVSGYRCSAPKILKRRKGFDHHAIFVRVRFEAKK